MRYLVTGGAGFIGSHLCEGLFAAGHTPIALDDLSTGKRSNLAQNIELIEGDCADASLLPELIARVDGVFHLAAIASVQQSVEQWSATSRTNQFATIALLEAISQRKGGAIPFVYASSAAIYGDPDAQYLPISEAAPTVPLTPYGADKLGSELHARLARRLFGIPTLGMRFFNVYGERQDPHSPYSGVISIFMERIAARQGITVFGDGQQTRDFIYVKDVCARLMAAMGALAAGQQPETHALNVCRGETVNLLQLAACIAKLYGGDLQLSHAAAREGDIKHSQGDAALCDALLTCPKPLSLEEGLRRMMDYAG